MNLYNPTGTLWTAHGILQTVHAHIELNICAFILLLIKVSAKLFVTEPAKWTLAQVTQRKYMLLTDHHYFRLSSVLHYSVVL